MPHPSVDLGSMSHYERRIEDIKDLLASIEEQGELHIGETAKLLAELADLEKHVARWHIGKAQNVQA